MADTFTALLHMTLPEIGASDDTWGDKLNDNFDILDALFGTTGQGTVIVRDTDDNALVSGVNITKAVGNARALNFKTGASQRWIFGANATAEGGANVGSDLFLNRYADDGTYLNTPLQISRANGVAVFEATPQVGGNIIYHSGNIGDLKFPVGVPVPWLMDTLPSANFLWLNGAVVSRSVYADLFNLWGIKFGAGNGATTFGLPDWREVVPVGKSTMGGAAARGLITHLALTDTAAAPVGEGKHVQAAGELVGHAHAVFAKDRGHLHTYGFYRAANQAGNQAGWWGLDSNVFDGTANTSSVSADIIIGSAVNGTDNSTASTGGNPPAGMNVVQPSTVCNWIVKAINA